VGFWSGISFFNLHEVYAEIHAIDLTANIDEVANFFRARVFVTPLQQGDVRNMPYADGYFDSVLMISILEHLPPEDLLQALVEVRRVLRPGGQLVYGAPVERPLMVTAFRLLGTNIRSQHFSTEKDIDRQAGESFRRVRVRRLLGPLGLFGSLYEVGHFARD